jgi:plasmid stabilization system protein ParE
VHYLSREARDDLHGIWGYIIREGRNEAIADRQIDAMNNV